MQVLQIFERIEKIETCTFATVLVTFHSILGLVGTLDLPVELLYADQVECVCKELTLDLHVELGVARK